MSKQSIAALLQKIHSLGPYLPGSLSEQWNVCGSPGCKCKDPDNPLKHGPYFQLSFTVDKKSSTMFIKEEDVKEVRQRISRYKKLKELINQLTKAYIDEARAYGFKKGG